MKFKVNSRGKERNKGVKFHKRLPVEFVTGILLDIRKNTYGHNDDDEDNIDDNNDNGALM